LWLPVSRQNFFNFTEDDWLQRRLEGDTMLCSSNRHTEPDGRPYVPLLLVGVLRRLLEVMPRSFGYDPVGRCTVRGDSGSRRRPVNVTMTLDLTLDRATPTNFWKEANEELVKVGATSVSLFVDENGAYCFTASGDDDADPELIGRALLSHIRQVFGGAYVVHPLPATTRKVDVGSTSLKDYNGLRDNDEPGRDPDDDDDVFVSEPKGVMSFSQLNILAEGLWNDMLSPAVYLEQREFMQRYLDGPESGDFLRSVADVIQALTTDTDATTTYGQIVTLHHFLTVTAGGSLLKLKSALESVRRRLLDEMLGALHRQSQLVQLRFSTNGHERRPELAVSATESQLKGYATLVAAKFPLIMGVTEMTRLASEHLTWVVLGGGPKVVRTSEEEQALPYELSRLTGQVRHWNAMVADLKNNVDSLGDTVHHAWMEELLSEEQQTRADQEAMAEIERSRMSRPINTRPGRVAYNLVMLVLAVVAVIFTVTSSSLSLIGAPGTTWLDVTIALWPVWAFVGFAFGVLPLMGIIWRARKEKRGHQIAYPYEFTFRLDESVEPAKLARHVGVSRRRRLATHELAGKLWVMNRGYGRIEHKSRDTTIVKVHTVVAFRVGWFKYARFEVISEILIHKIAKITKHMLIQCRTFGESPKPLTDKQLIELLEIVLGDLFEEIGEDDHLDVKRLIRESLYGSPQPPPRPRQPDHDASLVLR